MSDHSEDSAVALLRRLEPALSGIVAEIKELRRDNAAEFKELRRDINEVRKDIVDVRKDITDVKVAVATKPGRAEMWIMVSAMTTLFALILGGLAVLLQTLGRPS